MNRFLCFAVAVLLAAGVSAQTRSESWQQKCAGNVRLSEMKPASPQEKHCVPAENMYVVTCDITTEDADDVSAYLSAYNGDCFERIFLMNGEQPVFRLSEGVYDFYYECHRADRVVACVIKEGVEVKGDISLSFSTADADTKVVFNGYDKDGVLMRPDMMDANGNVMEEGTSDYMFLERLLIHEDYGVVSTYFGDWIYYTEGSELDNPFDFVISNVSDKYILAQVRVTEKDGEYYINKMSTRGTSVKEVANHPDEYVYHEEQFGVSPDSGERALMWSGVRLDILWGGLRDVGLILNSKSVKRNVGMYLDNVESDGGQGLDVVANAAFADDYFVKNYDLGFGMVYSDTIIFNTISPGNLVTAGGRVRYVNTGHSANGDAGFQMREDGSCVFLPAHEEFSFIKDELAEAPVMMDSAPFVSLMTALTEYQFVLTPTWIGQYGEIMTGGAGIAFELRGDGKLLSDGIEYTGIYDFCSELFMSGLAKGRMELTLRNSDVLIDGEIQSESEAVFNFDLDSEDCSSPTLQMLQIHDGSGLPAYRLKTNEGEICIAGGDFNYADNCFKATPAIFTLYYRPNGTEEWTELKLTEHEDMFREYVFGYYYTSSLDGIDAKSANGWFDLKIDASDDAGNTMSQVVNYALYIDDAKSVESVADNGMVFYNDGLLRFNGISVKEAALFASDGKAVFRFSCDAGYADISHLADGLYILSCEDEDGNIYKCKILK